MTTGSTFKQDYSYSTNILYYPKTGGTTLQGTAIVEGFRKRDWAGEDRPAVVYNASRPQGLKRTYTIPVEVKTRRGKLKTILVTKSFFERPILSRVERALYNIPHAYSVLHTELNDVKTYWVYLATQGDNVFGDMTVTRVSGWPAWGSVENPLPAFTDNDQLNLIAKLRTKVQGSDFNLATFMAEGSQTVAMIASTSARLAQAYLLARQGNLVKAAQVLTGSRKRAKLQKPVANNWLELQYGWLPLLSDMKSGAEQLAHLLNAPKSKTYRVRMRKRIDYDAPVFGWNWVTAYASISRDLYATLTTTPSLLETTGFLNPEVVAWELLPFSFVADWALPIGDYLQARAFASSLTGTFVTSDKEVTECKDIASQRRAYYEPSGHYVAPNSAYLKTVRLTRSVSDTLSPPLPSVKTVGEVFSWKHMLNGIALMVQTFKDPDLPGLDLKISRHQRRSNLMWNDIVNKSRNSF